MSKEFMMIEPIKKGKCACCGDIEWLYPDGDRLICGYCLQDKQIMDIPCPRIKRKSPVYSE